MPPEQRALPVDGSGGSLTAFRWTTYDVPFWARPNTRPGRWHRAGQHATQYWSLCPEVAWAELIRAEDLRAEEELDELRMPLWITRAPKAGLIDFTDPAEQEARDVTQAVLEGDDWTRTQAVADRLRADGVRGVIAPSAALPGHANLTLFGPRRAVDWHSRPTLASTLPATVVALGRPPRGLLPAVVRPAGPMPRLF